MDNLKFYNQFRSVPAEAQKTIQAGKLKGFTDINPMWRIKMLTEVFGACGTGWYTGDVKMWVENSAGESAAFCSLNLYVKREGEWMSPIFGIGGSKLSGKGVGDGINDEAFKMAYTDALSIACKNLGMAADIYFANDRTKYNAQDAPTQEVRTKRPARGAETAAYTPMPENMYWKVVAAYAQGKKTKTGGDYKQTWIETTHADAAAILKFDEDVNNLLAATQVTEEVRRRPMNNDSI